MPANVSPEYRKAEQAFKRARDPKERLECLREMLRTIPKHKGSEHLQAEIKTRIKHLSEELGGPRKGAGRRGPSHVVRPEGAAQIALLGPPNSGKSALHARLTGSHAEVGPYPFTTIAPLPGMHSYEDVHFQLVDLPPLARDRSLPWIGEALQHADGSMLVVDLRDPECVEQVAAVAELLAERHVFLLEPEAAARMVRAEGSDEASAEDPFALRLPTLLVASKADRSPDVEGELATFAELSGIRLPRMAVSASSGLGLEKIGRRWFETLGIVRVYTKAPGRPPDMHQPFSLRRGDTVVDVARLVHRELAERLKYARLWGRGSFDGQQVGREHPISDGDVLELHV